MKTEDRFSYVMLFCAMLMARKSRAMFEKMVPLTPLSVRAKNLAAEMLSQGLRTETFPSNPF